MEDDNTSETPAERKRPLIPREGWAALFIILLGLAVWGGWEIYSRVRKAGEEMFEGVLATMLADAVLHYAEEHGGRFPSPPAPAENGGRDTDTDTSPAAGLMAALTDGDLEKTGGYFLPKEQRGKIPPGGLRTGKPDSELLIGNTFMRDLRGNVYRVRLDTSGDGTVENPNMEADRRTGKWVPRYRAAVVVWSAGPDGDWSTWWDNVVHVGKSLPPAPSSGPGAAAAAPRVKARVPGSPP